MRETENVFLTQDWEYGFECAGSHGISGYGCFCCLPSLPGLPHMGFWVVAGFK